MTLMKDLADFQNSTAPDHDRSLVGNNSDSQEPQRMDISGQVLKISLFVVIALGVGFAVFATSLFDRSSAALLILQLVGGQSGQVVCSEGRVEIVEVVSPTSVRTRCVIAGSPNPSASPDSSPTTQPSVSPGTSDWQPFGSVSFSADQNAFTVDGAGVNVDTIAFWDAPDPTQSLMFVTSKNVSLVEVWQYPYQSSNGLADIADSCLDSNTNGVFVDQETDELYVVTTNTGKVCVYNLPDMTLAREFDTQATSPEPNLALLKLPSGEKRLYVTSDTTVYVFDAVTGTELSISPFAAPASSIETAYADNYYQEIYIPSEQGDDGIHIASPDGVTDGIFGDASLFAADAEGIWLYTCPKSGVGDDGTGLIFATDQAVPTEIEVFDRVEKTHLGTFTLAGVSNTDGIALTQQSSPQYPEGVFAAINDDSQAVGIGMDILMQGMGLSCVAQ